MAHVCTSSGMSRTARTSPSRSRCTVVSGTGEDAVRLGVLGRRPLAVHGADFGPALPVDGPEPVALVGVADHDPPHGLRVAARRRLGGVLDDRPDVLVGHGSRRVQPPHGPADTPSGRLAVVCPAYGRRMGDRRIDTLVEGGSFFEGPRWHDGRWWVSDFYRQTVFAVDPSGGQDAVLTVEGQPSGLGWRPDGTLLVVSMKDRLLLGRSPEGAVDVVADLTAFSGGSLNDMVVDAEGRAYVGNFGFDLMSGERPRLAGLVRVDPDGTVAVAAEGLKFPNGAVITPDGATLVVGETTGGALTAFTVGAGGELTGRRTWAATSGVAPDGIALDLEGRIWVADGGGGPVLLVAEGGEVVDRVQQPDGLGVYACMLGGEDGRTLLMCAAPDYFEHNRARAREAVLLTTTVDVPRGDGLP